MESTNELEDITENPTRLLGSKIIPLTYALIIGHLLLNFLGTPLLKYYYVLEVIFFLICAIIYPLSHIIIPIFALFFIEGQGRILWDYHPVFRVIFDFTLFIALLKSLAVNNTLVPKNSLPTIILLTIFGHFCWYIIQIFNISSVGLVGVIGASKIYIFPLLMFFMLLANSISSNKKILQQLQYFTLFMFISESLLIIFQMGVKEGHLLKISPFYSYAMKNNIFIAETFRPFGTSYLPGGFSTYMFLTVGLLFLVPMKNTFHRLVTTSAIGLSWFCLFLMQVRSTFAKQMAIIFLIQIFLFITSKFKFKTFIKFGVLFVALFAYLLTLPNIADFFPTLDLEQSIDRVSIFSNLEKIKSARLNPAVFYDTITKKLSENPLGLGPGRTGAATNLSLDIIMSDPLWDERSSWSSDNLFISLSIDLGLGMFFYSILILSFPILLLNYAFSFYRKREINNFRITLISGIVTLVILAGNWGAVGIPYNPESFMFWFWTALGFNKKREADLSDEMNKRKIKETVTINA